MKFIRDNGFSPISDVVCGGDSRFYNQFVWVVENVGLCALYDGNGINTDDGITFELNTIRKRYVSPSLVEQYLQVTTPVSAEEGVLTIISPALTHPRGENEGIVAIFSDGSRSIGNRFLGNLAELDCNGDTCTTNIPDGTVRILVAYLYDVAGYKFDKTDWLFSFIRDNGFSPISDVVCGGDSRAYNLNWNGVKKVGFCSLSDRNGINTDDGITFELTTIRKRQVSSELLQSLIDRRTASTTVKTYIYTKKHKD